MLSTTKLKQGYRVGDRISAKVIEQIDETDWIVSLEGTLIKIVKREGISQEGHVTAEEYNPQIDADEKTI